jgi:putative ABC transport system permease protein
MNLFKLARKSLRHRFFSTAATIFSIVLSLLLLFSVERIRRSVEDSFTQSVSGIDLIVGARTAPLNLVLFSVFNIGQPTNNISFATYEKLNALDDIEWTIPYSLGDGHKGYRVVGTNNNFFSYYQVRNSEPIKISQGSAFSKPTEVVLGSEVAEVLNYKIGDKIVLAHGSTSGESFEEHADQPFLVVGIMQPTGTAVDRSLYIDLMGLEALHHDESDDKDHSHHDHSEPENITSFFVKLKSKTKVLKIQRDITEYKGEALIAVMPTATLADLWKSLSQIEFVLKLISGLVMIVGLIGMLIALISSLNERRREMAILRSVGAGYKHLALLVFLEVITILGIAVILSAFLKVLLELSLSGFLQKKYGIFLTGNLFSSVDLMMMALTFALGIIFSLVPILIFKNKSLKDGLAVK